MGETAGTWVRLRDGREGTVVYSGLDGVGIKWGCHEVPAAEIRGTGRLFGGESPENYPWFPDAMLREPYPSATLECVGEAYTVIPRDGEWRRMMAEAWLRDHEGVDPGDWAGWLGVTAATPDEDLVTVAEDASWCAAQEGIDLVGMDALADRLRAEARADAADRARDARAGQ